MKITCLKIQNFKKFDELEIKFESNFSIIIGKNNIGKTSIFEALQLWKKCYDVQLRSDKINFYKNTQRYLNFYDLDFIRLHEDVNLFRDGRETKITLEVEVDYVRYNLGFSVAKPSSISNSYYRCNEIDSDQFKNFAICMKDKKMRLDKFISIYSSNPISSIKKNEPIMNKGQINSKLNKAKSNEILRNKIIRNYDTNDKLNKLGEHVGNVLGYDVKFLYKNKNAKNEDEFIRLNVEAEGKELELITQGSGFLQVTEIFSTIGFMDSGINLLLVDEPDSHIYEKQQKNLYQELQSITDSMVIVITHSDSFLSEVGPKELFYIDEFALQEKIVTPIEDVNFDKIKSDLGGTIMGLEKLSESEKIVFVEGKDDIDYIDILGKKYIELNGNSNYKIISYIYLRGKDYIGTKLDNNVRTIRQFVGRNRILGVIFDKDFSTSSSNNTLKNALKSKLGANSFAFTHDGYCFESVMFSDKTILKRFLKKIIQHEGIDEFVDEKFSQYRTKLRDTMSDECIALNECFEGQKKKDASRPELANVNFTMFIHDTLQGDDIKLQYVANKKFIRTFFDDFQSRFNFDMITEDLEDNKDSTYTEYVFKKYLQSIESNDDIFESLTNLMEELYA